MNNEARGTRKKLCPEMASVPLEVLAHDHIRVGFKLPMLDGPPWGWEAQVDAEVYKGPM